MDNSPTEGLESNNSATRRAVLRGIGLGGVAAAFLATGWRVETVAQDTTPEMAVEPNTLVVLYGEPTDQAEFVDYYTNSHVPLALTLPTLQTTDYGPLLGLPGRASGSDFWFAVLRFADAADLQASLASDAGKQVLADVKNFATGGATVYLSHLETSTPGDALATPEG